ncbi:hypothetical protein [Flexibacterium corallicola]|uniref:hypothetical protein n=1 Tax=Flexibacterium corallicola TaxID=3037259 RepID=UPI00286F9C0C|nr:hypothetical protein [Pseudovibrio sp. M1P-2-3]
MVNQRVPLLLFGILLCLPETVFARTDPGSSPSTKPSTIDTVGAVLKRALEDSWTPFFILVVIIAGLVGLMFIFKGFLKLAGGERGGGVGVALSYITAGAVLIALPDAAGMGMISLFDYAQGGDTLVGSHLDFSEGENPDKNFLELFRVTGDHTVAETLNCFAQAKDKQITMAPATCMAQNIATNIIPILIVVVFALLFFVGFLLFASAVIGLAGVKETRQPTSGLITQGLIAILMMNSPFLMEVLTTTFLGNISGPVGTSGLVQESKFLSYNGGTGNGEFEALFKYKELVKYSLWIAAGFGVVTFARGLTMAHAVSKHGRQVGTYSMAIVFVIAGIALTNLKVTSCLVLNSLYGNGASQAGLCE